MARRQTPRDGRLVRRCLGAAWLLVAMACAMLGWTARAEAQEERRLGLVIGNSEYAAGALPTAANDAGLVAQTLQAAGFDVMGARDLDGETLRATFRDFVDKVSASGPDTVAFVYLAGHGLQLEGENYFAPVDARIDRDVDIPLRALRISDYIRPLSALRTKGVIVVLDAGRQTPFRVSGQPLAGGLALVEPARGTIVAFNAAPGTIASPAEPPYGPYAQALAEMMREGGLPIGAVFDRVRLRVHEATSGAEVPWHGGQLAAPVVLFERAPDAPAEVSLQVTEERRGRPIQAFNDVQDAYLAALERDTLDGYIEFIRAFPDHPLAKRVRAIVAARREAITWRRARNADSPEAYWSYLERYPNGPHAPDARRRLAYLTAPFDPPPRYTAYAYDIPPPLEEEIVYVRRPVVYFADPVWAFVPPPPPPIFFLPPPPPPRFFRPPPPPIALFVLPTPIFVPVPVYVRPPRYVAPPPPTNAVFRSIHGPQPGAGGPPPGPPGGVPPSGARAPGAAPAGGGGPSAGAIAAGVAAGVAVGAAAAVMLPPSVQKRAATTPGGPPGAGPQRGPGATPAALPGVVPPGGPGAGGAKGPNVQPPTGLRPLPGAPAGVPPVKGAPPVPNTAAGTPPVPAQPGSVPRIGPPAKQPVQQGALPPPNAKGPPPMAPNAPAAKTGATPPLSAPPANVRQQQIDRAQQDRAAIEKGVEQNRQREMERRRQEQDAQARARAQNQQQDLQRQRQQQMDAQRKAMEQQRQQQQAAQAAARAQAQQQQAAQAAARAQAQQQQAAQAAARAQAEAQARARAQQQQAKPKTCGGQGQPPCPR